MGIEIKEYIGYKIKCKKNTQKDRTKDKPCKETCKK